MSISDIVDISIDLQTTAVPRQGFGTILIVGDTLEGTFRTREYSSLSEVGDDFSAGDPEYDSALKIFSQNPRPPKIVIGQEAVGDANVGATLDAIFDEDQSWYWINWVKNRTQADVEAVASWAEANKRVFLTASDDVNITDSAVEVTSIAYSLKNSGYERSGVLFNEDADTDWPESAFMAELATRVPGSYTGAFKQLVGVSPSPLTTSKQNTALGKSANIYVTKGGVNITRNGTFAKPEFIDIIVGIDWLKARLEENIYFQIVNLPKVPFTDAGIAIITGAMRPVFEEGIDNQFISPPAFDSDNNQTGGYIITAPLASDISANDKALRQLTGITFKAWLAGAIHKTVINGVVVL